MFTQETTTGKPTPIDFDWTLGSKIRDGRYGPVFLGLRTDTGDLISAEEFPLQDGQGNGSKLETVLANLQSMLASPSHPNVISYLGYQHTAEGRILILAEYLPGGTLRDLIQSYGAVPRPLARMILRQVASGFEHLRSQQGVSPVFLDLGMVMIDNVAAAKIEPPLLPHVAGQQQPPPPPPPPAGVPVPPPEALLPGRWDLGKADVWLLGVLAAQMLMGKCGLGEGVSATSVVGCIKEAPGSALELIVPGDVAGKLGEQTADLIRRCLSVNFNDRPSIPELLEHPFFSELD